MNTLYNQEQNQQALNLFKEATKISFDYSVSVWEKQIDLFNQTATRQMNRVSSLQQLGTPEAVIDFQKKVSADELSELQKVGEEYYKLSDGASRDLTAVAEKSQRFVEGMFSEAVKQASVVFPNGKSEIFSDAVRNTSKTVGEVYQNGIEAATQAMRTGVETALQGQQVVTNAKNGKRGNKSGK